MNNYMRYILFFYLCFSCVSFKSMFINKKKYPLSQKYYEEALKRLNKNKQYIEKNSFLNPMKEISGNWFE